jgi:small basic protein (TIGR04137 family)
MSLDRSLCSAGHLTRHRNVLTRPERVGKLAEKGKFDLELGDPIGLPKVGNRKIAAGGKGPKKDAAAAAPGAAGAPAAAAPAAAAPAAGAKSAKGAKPAKGAEKKK